MVLLYVWSLIDNTISNTIVFSIVIYLADNLFQKGLCDGLAYLGFGNEGKNKIREHQHLMPKFGLIINRYLLFRYLWF